MDKRLFLAQFASTTFGRIASAGLQAISLVLVARSIVPSEFGLLSSVLGLALIAQTVFDLGIAPFVMRERSANRDSGLVTAALLLNNRLSIALSIITGGAFLVLGFQFQRDLLLLLPLAVWMSSERNADVWLEVSFADGDWKINLRNLLLRRFLPIPLYLILRIFNTSPFLSYSSSVAVAGLISSTLARRVVAPLLPPRQDIRMAVLLRETWPYWLNSLATQVRNLDVTFAAMVASTYQAGLYATANRLTSPLRLVPTSMARAVLPAATKSRGRELRSLYLLVTLTLGAMTAFYSILYFVLPPLLPHVLGDKYQSASPALKFVILGLPFAAGSSLVGALLQGLGYKTFVAHSALFSTLFYLCAVMICAHYWGARGAAAALSISFIIQFVAVFMKLLEGHFGKKHWEHAGQKSLAAREG